MDVFRDLEQCRQAGVEHALTIGFYDGVHLGHRAVIGAAQATARRLGIKMALVTFNPHPAQVLRPESVPLLLTDLDHKLELLDEAGVETVVVVPFDAERSTETAEAFVEEVVVGCLAAKAVIVGRDFHFGKGRAGNVELLQELGHRHDFDVEGVQLLPGPNGVGESVSSTAIRRALAAGKLATAAKLLGRHHEVRGPVVTGDQRGRTIGFPTANVAIAPRMAMPADAVYAGWYFRPDGSRWPAAVNIGRRPTFYDEAEHSLVEAHLIGFEGDLYGESARIQLVDLLRGEQRFDGVKALSAQLQRDVVMALQVLSERDGGGPY